MNIFVLFGIYVFEFCAYLDLSSTVPVRFVTLLCAMCLLWTGNTARNLLCIVNILCALFTVYFELVIVYSLCIHNG